MKVLVTGATGFIGGHLVEMLVERGDDVHALVRPGEDSSHLRALAGVEIMHGDLTDAASLKCAVRGMQRVYHVAAKTGPWGPEEVYRAINVQGLANLIHAAMDAAVQRIVHVSSVTVHGVDVHGTADETAPVCGGSDPYSRSKVAGEQLLQHMVRDKGVPVTIVRPGLVYGPRDTSSFGRFATLIEQGKMVVIGPGNNHLPLIYVTDVAQGILLASTADRALGREYILVNDEPAAQCDYLNAIASELGVPPPSQHIPYRLALSIGVMAEMTGRLLHWKQSPPLTRFGVEALGGENRFTINRARSELGFIPQVSLAEGVRKGIAWYRATRCAVRS